MAPVWQSSSIWLRSSRQKVRQPYTLVFVSTDAEELGMVGSGRYVQTHPNPSNIIAGFSLDNVGRPYYDGVTMELTGQYRKFGPLWLALTVREAALHTGNEWKVNITALLDQITGQMAPISFMDEGPLVAAGIPAVGYRRSRTPGTSR